jgi:hypothetical protein
MYTVPQTPVQSAERRKKRASSAIDLLCVGAYLQAVEDGQQGIQSLTILCAKFASYRLIS